MDDREPRASLLHLPDARPGADFTARVLARVERWERRRAAGDGAAARGGWLPPGRRGTLVAAGLAAAVVAALGLWRPEGEWWTGRAPEATSPGGGERLDEGTDERRPGAGRAGGASARDGERIDERKGASRSAGTEGGGAGAPRSGERLDEGAAAAGRWRHDRPDASSDAAGASEGDASRSPGSVASGAAASSTGGERGRAAAPADRQPGATDRLAAGGRAETAAGALSTAATPSTPFADRGSPPPAAAAPPRLAAADFFAAPPAAAPADPGAELLAARLARLAAERERLAARLAEFRRELPPAEPPVVLLGVDEGLELVFDVGRFATGHPPEARPAVHSTAGPPHR